MFSFASISVDTLLSDPTTYQTLKSKPPIGLFWMVCWTIVRSATSHENLDISIPAGGNTKTKVNAVIHTIIYRHYFKKLNRSKTDAASDREHCEWFYRGHGL